MKIELIYRILITVFDIYISLLCVKVIKYFTIHITKLLYNTKN
jgi:hypothetical protein